MGRHTCCFKQKLRKGLWSPEEDEKLLQHITKHGHGCWSSVPKLAGLQRCGKSCRLRWINYLRPDLKRGAFTDEEENLIIQLHAELGNRWSQIAAHLPGRTDNEIKNLWNSSIKKRLRDRGLDPNARVPISAEPEAVGISGSSAAEARDPADSMVNSIFEAFDAGGAMPPALPPTLTGCGPMTGLLHDVRSGSACVYWESNSSSSIELHAGNPLVHSGPYPWPEFATSREFDRLHLEGELDELKWSDFLHAAASMPFPSHPFPGLQNQNSRREAKAEAQFAIEEPSCWEQMQGLPPPHPSLPPAPPTHQHRRRQQQ